MFNKWVYLTGQLPDRSGSQSQHFSLERLSTMSLSQTLCKFLTPTFIIFVELDPQNHQEKSLHNLRRGLLQVLSSTELLRDSVPCVGAIKDYLLILSHLTVTAAAASVEVREMLTPLWHSATTSAQLLSITGTALSTPLNIPRMPLGSCSLPGPARGTAMWVKFPLPYNSFYHFFFFVSFENKPP